MGSRNGAKMQGQAKGEGYYKVHRLRSEDAAAAEVARLEARHAALEAGLGGGAALLVKDWGWGEGWRACVLR